MAKIKLTGDFKTLDAWAARIGRAGNDQSLQELSANLAEEALDLVQEGFRTETDPYGKRWARKAFPDGRQVLVGRTARLRRGWHARSVTSRGFRLSPSVDYAKYHQQGRGPVHAKSAQALRFQIGNRTVFRKSVGPAPARKMVPDKGRLPSAWRRAFLSVARAYYVEVLGGRA